MAAKNIQDVVPYAVNFSVVVVFLAVMLKKPLRKFVYQRHERMKDSFEAAAMAHQKASARASQARRALEGATAEEDSILSRERQFAEQEKKEIQQKTDHEAARLLAEAERMAANEQDEALGSVKEKFLDLVVRETEDSLRKGLKKDDHSAILKRAQNSIEVGV
jgi:F-type H+-transporting ATPase subunit b